MVKGFCIQGGVFMGSSSRTHHLFKAGTYECGHLGKFADSEALRLVAWQIFSQRQWIPTIVDSFSVSARLFLFQRQVRCEQASVS